MRYIDKRIYKKQGKKAFCNDLKRIDCSKLTNEVREKVNINYANDYNNEHTVDVYYKAESYNYFY